MKKMYTKSEIAQFEKASQTLKDLEAEATAQGLALFSPVETQLGKVEFRKGKKRAVLCVAGNPQSGIPAIDRIGLVFELRELGLIEKEES